MMQLPKSAVRSLRSQLDKLMLNPKNGHAGLTLDRYLEAHKPTDPEERAMMKGPPPEEAHLDLVAQIAATEVYNDAFSRWQLTVDELGSKVLKARLVSSLAVGLGNESPMEVGLTVHHTYGMPLIPGSAIKGMCKRGATILRAEGKLDEGQFTAVFGDTKAASPFVFWDAWYIPNSVDGKPFHRDVVTVHHKKYYNKGSAWPTDFDDPNPVPFLVVKPGAEFLFAMSAPTPNWGEFVRELLKWCLENIGIGGKTNAGYGYFKPIQENAQVPSPSAAETRTRTKPTAPPGSVTAVVKVIGHKWIDVAIEGHEGVVRCAGLTPAGLGLGPDSIVFVEIKRDRKRRVISAVYKGKPKE